MLNSRGRLDWAERRWDWLLLKRTMEELKERGRRMQWKIKTSIIIP